MLAHEPIHRAWDEVDLVPAPPGTSLGQMDATALFSEVTSALGLQPLGIYTPWATRSGDVSWEEIKNPDTNIAVFGITDAQIAQAQEVTFGSPLPFVGVVTKAPLTTEAVRQMWMGTAYQPYETQAIYSQADAKAVPTILFLHWGERIDVAELPSQVLQIAPRAAAVDGSLVFAAQVPVQSTTSRAAPPTVPFAGALNSQMASAAPSPVPTPGPSPIPINRQPESLHLGVPIAVGLGCAFLGYFFWSKRRHV